MSLTKLYTPKQIEILETLKRKDWDIVINHGAKRSGKTVLNNDLFLMELKRVREIADKNNIDMPQYILAGYTLSNIQDNILNELTNKYGLEFKFDRYNNFVLMGVKIIQTSHGSVSGIGRIRGMTAYGAYINEASLCHPEVFDEIKARCSGDGARTICDTNPDNPEHWLLKDYIENPHVLSFHFELDDNTFLNERYKENIKKSTPTGMLYDRAIKGLWVSGEGVVYRDFDKEKHYIQSSDLPELETFYCGVDWGYDHLGSIVVIGQTKDGVAYMVEEYASQYKEIDYWVDIAKGIQERYGSRVPFYCDSARPEYVARFRKERIKSFNAKKSRLSGVEEVAKRIKTGTLFFCEDKVKQFKQEIYQYVWDKDKGEPIKKHDDVLDALRYAIYSHNRTKTKIQTVKGGF